MTINDIVKRVMMLEDALYSHSHECATIPTTVAPDIKSESPFVTRFQKYMVTVHLKKNAVKVFQDIFQHWNLNSLTLQCPET